MNSCKYKIKVAMVVALACTSGGVGYAAKCKSVTALAATVAAQEDNDVKRMQKQLLGPYYDVQALTSSNICHAYITFMQNTRSLESSWTNADWDTVQEVAKRLDKKYNSMSRIVSVSNKAQIKVLQAEFQEILEQNTATKL